MCVYEVRVVRVQRGTHIYIFIMCRPSNKKQLVQTYVHALASNNKKINAN